MAQVNKDLLEKYKKLNWNKSGHTIDEISEYLKEKFNAKEICDDSLLGLVDDPLVDDSKITGLYHIYDLNILDKLYNEEEKTQYKIMAMEFEGDSILPELKIAIESDDNKSMSGYTIQGGQCDKLYYTLLAFMGCSSEDEFESYLETLVSAGILV